MDLNNDALPGEASLDHPPSAGFFPTSFLRTAQRHWEMMPEVAKAFLLQSLDSINIHTLVKFWSSPKVVKYTRGEIATDVCGASWCLALSYSNLGKMREARAMTLNGSFLLQCSETSIETIAEMCEGRTNTPMEDFDLPLYRLGYHSVGSPQSMEAYLHQRLPPEYKQTMDSLVKTSSVSVMKYVDQIGDDWSCKSRRSQRKPCAETSTQTLINLILVDDTNKDERQEFRIGSSTNLKTLFKDFAEKRCVSLRSLRFSYEGKTLFLSSVGNKTPDQLNMRDQDVISVCGTNTSQETTSENPKRKSMKAPGKMKTAKHSTKFKKKGTKKKSQSRKEEAETTLEDCKTQHSIKLSKLHAEAYLQLKQIRMQLNVLQIQRQPPKQKKRNTRRKSTKVQVHAHALPNTGIGGKAGKPYFLVQVGEVHNLYKTTKPSQWRFCAESTLDLHGCSREEAAVKLDESLAVWIDTAMQGLYPFVIPVKIVCGCGNQILSETVVKWIREHAQVANAMKNSVL